MIALFCPVRQYATLCERQAKQCNHFYLQSSTKWLEKLIIVSTISGSIVLSHLKG
ncbi:hypothetical protein XETH111194_11585 [Xenorhabdus thuongxuanensis]